jgi:hypothetical protein
MQIMLLVVFMLLTIVVKMVVPPMLIRRAVRPVIERFLHFGAVDESNAKTILELGLGPKRLAERMVSLRDYKPKALDALVGASIVRSTEEGKLYLSKDKLWETGMLERWPDLARRLRSAN